MTAEEMPMELSTGALVKSAAGHDKGGYFLILREVGEYIYLVDGKSRRLNCPKKKKKKHVEPLLWEKHSPGLKIRENKSVTDEEIKHFIRCFKREEQVVRR
ncbi:KOW domain-containing RNA-binding protein [Lacrimispora sp.]|jgi:ribosomal protein L14E/L6E/L27E|uniref:KOW domain-containing RNA-binding protein n=1 Tax=Lacrimispora sp. TaxID=2719234 RepID=UPI0028AC010D|nr:KOW domain-containing RNA-binding protein [Lacrimispora sp.]